MKLIISSVIAGIILSGCAAGIVGKIPEVGSDGYATIFMARKAGFIGCGSAILIQLNDQDFIRIDCGMKTSFKVPAGKKIKVSSVSSLVSDHIYLEPKKGEAYYFAADCNMASCWFDKLSLNEYKKIEKTCEKVLDIKQ